MSLSKAVTKKVLSANISKLEYDIYAGFTKKQDERFLESLKEFVPPTSRVNHCSEFANIGLKPQSKYTDIPFRAEKYDSTSTVATDGSAIIVAKFLERMYRCEINASVKELAELAVKKGYRGYKRQADGSYQSKGVRHIFWERFIPSLYGLESKRALSIRDMLNGLWDYRLSVILMSDEPWENEKENIKSRFILLTGFSPEEIVFFDPQKCMANTMKYTTAIPRMRAAWIIWEEEEY